MDDRVFPGISRKTFELDQATFSRNIHSNICTHTFFTSKLDPNNLKNIAIAPN